MGPPEMPEEALAYYQDAFESFVETDSWKDYAEQNGLVTQLRIGEEWGDFLNEQNEVVKETLEEVDLLKGD